MDPHKTLFLPYGTRALLVRDGEKLLLAQYFHQRMSESQHFEVGPPPDLSVVTFRLRGDDAANKKLLDAIHTDGRIFLSSTRLTRQLSALHE